MQTRNGQEIVTERLVNDLSSDRFMRDVIKVRMDKVITKVKQGATKAQAFSDKVNKQAESLRKKIDKTTLSKLDSAQSIIKNLTCP